jgi:hypothetical protein
MLSVFPKEGNIRVSHNVQTSFWWFTLQVPCLFCFMCVCLEHWAATRWGFTQHRVTLLLVQVLPRDDVDIGLPCNC